MSRNFELLQRAENERGREPHRGNGRRERTAWFNEPTTFEPLAGVRSFRNLYQKKGDEVSEVSKLVHSLFIEPDPVTAHSVAFANVDAVAARNAVCARAGELLASRVTGSVCLLDANLAVPSLHQYFGVENHFGWAEALQQARPIQDFLRAHERANLSFVTSGTVVEGWEELFQEEAIAGRMQQLCEQFDYVLVLCPPPSAYPEAQILGRLADGMVLVVEANSTPRNTAVRLKADLEEAGVRLLGTVLNNRTFPIPDVIYSGLDLLFRR